MKGKRYVIEDPKDVRDFIHPIRFQIMQMMRKQAEPMTVKMIADELGIKHGNAFYHVKKLESLGVIEVIKTTNINGIIAKYYLRKYDYIMYDTAHVMFKNMYEFNKYSMMAYTSFILDFLDEVHPTEMSGEDEVLVKDFVYKEHYNFEQKDIAAITDEILAVYDKYNKKTDSSIEYSTLLGIGKHRKEVYTFVEDIKKRINK